MGISIEKIDVLIQRANVSYEEAKEALNETNEDLVEALIYLEKREKIKEEKESTTDNKNKSNTSYVKKIKDTLKSIHLHKFKILRNNETIINIPATIAILLLIITMPFSLIVLGILIFMKFKIIVKNNDKTVMNINDTID